MRKVTVKVEWQGPEVGDNQRQRLMAGLKKPIQRLTEIESISTDEMEPTLVLPSNTKRKRIEELGLILEKGEWLDDLNLDIGESVVLISITALTHFVFSSAHPSPPPIESKRLSIVLKLMMGNKSLVVDSITTSEAKLTRCRALSRDRVPLIGYTVADIPDVWKESPIYPITVCVYEMPTDMDDLRKAVNEIEKIKKEVSAKYGIHLSDRYEGIIPTFLLPVTSRALNKHNSAAICELYSRLLRKGYSVRMLNNGAHVMEHDQASKIYDGVYIHFRRVDDGSIDKLSLKRLRKDIYAVALDNRIAVDISETETSLSVRVFAKPDVDMQTVAVTRETIYAAITSDEGVYKWLVLNKCVKALTDF